MATRDYQFITGPETSTLPTGTTPTLDGDDVTLAYGDQRFLYAVADVAAAKAVTTTRRQNNSLIWVKTLNAYFYFDTASSATNDDLTILTPTSGTGRWLILRTYEQGVVTLNASAGSKTIKTGSALQEAYKTIGSGHTYTVQTGAQMSVGGQLIVSGSGSLVVQGTGIARVY